MNIEIGMLDRVVIIQKITETQGGNGEINQIFVDSVKVRLKKIDRSAVLKYFGDEQFNVNSVFWVGHYREDISPRENRLVDERGEFYEITGVREIEGRETFNRKMWMMIETKNSLIKN